MDTNGNGCGVAKKYELQEVWRRYYKDRGLADRQVLIVHYMPYAKVHAQVIYAKVRNSHSQIDLDDLVQASYMGLDQAVKAFDPYRNTKFETFSTTRIRGAVIDYLRDLDWTPRSTRSRINQVNKLADDFCSKNGYMPSDDDVRQILGLSSEEGKELMSFCRRGSPVSYSGGVVNVDADFCVDSNEVFIDSSTSFSDVVLHDKELMRTVFGGFTKEEKLVMILYYYEKMIMREIALTLGICESRVSQIHRSLILRLASNTRVIKILEECVR